LLVKVANTTTGPATLQVNAMAARPVKAMGTGDLLQNDITSGDIKLFYYDGTNFQITPNLLINANWTVQVPSQYPTVGAALSAIMRKRIHSSAIVTVQIAAGAVAPFSIYHPDADRLVIKGTMLAAAPTINDLQRTGATYAPIVADGWANLAVLKARYGTQITVAAGQTGIANVGPGNPTIADILIMGPFSMAANPSNAGNSWWDLSSAVWTEPNRTITCTNIAAWGMGWACFEGRGKLFAHNCITIASINGMSSRFAGGFIQANNCILNSNAYTGVNADSQSTWQGTGCYVLSNGTAGIQPLNLGYCEAYSCNITANGFWDVQSGYLSLSSLIGCAYITATPPMNGGIAGFGGVNQAG
jgi:hypothetical protein